MKACDPPRAGDGHPEEPSGRLHGLAEHQMDGLREFLDDLKQRGLAQANLLGLLHVLIGRRVARADGTLVANGVTWRVLAEALKRARWDKDAVRQVGLEPGALAPRDRQRYWYQA